MTPVGGKKRHGDCLSPFSLPLFHQIFPCLHQASQAGSHPSIHPSAQASQPGNRFLPRQANSSGAIFFSCPSSLAPSLPLVRRFPGDRRQQSGGGGGGRQQVKAKCTCARRCSQLLAVLLSLPGINCCLDVVFPVVVVVVERGCPSKGKMTCYL